jgi:hypothetical protein
MADDTENGKTSQQAGGDTGAPLADSPASSLGSSNEPASLAGSSTTKTTSSSDVEESESGNGNGSGGSLTEVPYDPKRPVPGGIVEPEEKVTHDDVSRRWIANWLLGLLTLLIIGAFVGFYRLFSEPTKPTFEQFKTLVELILTPLITLVSAATGFYFGSATKK